MNISRLMCNKSMPDSRGGGEVHRHTLVEGT
jgi:hypothetical protein